MAFDSTKVRQTNYDAMWDTQDLGGLDDVKINMDLIFLPVKIGSAGNMKLEDRFQGLNDDAHVLIVVREVTLALIRKLVPWAGATGAAALTPPIGTGMTQYAKQLTLHPRDMLLVTTEDMEFWKAVPVQSYKLPRNGQDFDKWEVRFNLYPDPAKIAAGTHPYAQIKGA